MTLLDKLNAAFLKARKEKYTIAINELSTLKGDVENAVKSGEDATAAIERLAVKAVKNLESFKSGMWETKVLILNEFTPQQMSDFDLDIIILEVLKEYHIFALEYNNGNKGKMGMLMGQCVKRIGKSATPKRINRTLQKMLAHMTT